MPGMQADIAQLKALRSFQLRVRLDDEIASEAIREAARTRVCSFAIKWSSSVPCVDQTCALPGLLTFGTAAAFRWASARRFSCTHTPLLTCSCVAFARVRSFGGTRSDQLMFSPTACKHFSRRLQLGFVVQSAALYSKAPSASWLNYPHNRQVNAAISASASIFGQICVVVHSFRTSEQVCKLGLDALNAESVPSLLCSVQWGRCTGHQISRHALNQAHFCKSDISVKADVHYAACALSSERACVPFFGKRDLYPG